MKKLLDEIGGAIGALLAAAALGLVIWAYMAVTNAPIFGR